MSKYIVKEPILGFEDIKEVEIKKHDGISALLTGTCENYLQLTLLHTHYDKDSEFNIPEDIKTILEISEDSTVSVYLIVILDKDIEKSTIDLTSPLIFNEDNNTMAQAIITEEQGNVS